jgi:hypothetical protein
MRGLIEEQIGEIDTIIERLEIDEEHQPLRLLGLKASYELMNEIYTTLLGVLLAVGQRLFTDGGDE